MFASRMRSVPTCTIRGLWQAAFAAAEIVAVSFSMLDQQLHYRRSIMRALNSRPRFFRPSCGYRRHYASEHYVSFFSNFEAPLASAASCNSTVPRLIGTCFLLPSRQFVRARRIDDLCRACQTKGGVPASAGSFRRKVGRAVPSSVGASSESRRFTSDALTLRGPQNRFFGSISTTSGLFVAKTTRRFPSSRQWN